MKCKESVWHSTGNCGTDSQCSREAVKDGYCKQHHPDAVHSRRAARDAKYARESSILRKQREIAEAERAVVAIAVQWRAAAESQAQMTQLVDLQMTLSSAVDALKRLREELARMR